MSGDVVAERETNKKARKTNAFGTCRDHSREPGPGTWEWPTAVRHAHRRGIGTSAVPASPLFALHSAFLSGPRAAAAGRRKPAKSSFDPRRGGQPGFYAPPLWVRGALRTPWWAGSARALLLFFRCASRWDARSPAYVQRGALRGSVRARVTGTSNRAWLFTERQRATAVRRTPPRGLEAPHPNPSA